MKAESTNQSLTSSFKTTHTSSTQQTSTKIDEENPKSTRLELAFYASGGFCCFVVMYCMMSISSYNEQVYGSKGYLAMVFAANLGGISAFLFTKKLMSKLSKLYALILLPTFNFLVILMLVVVGKYVQDQDSFIKIGCNLFGNYTFGVSLFVLRYLYSKIVFSKGATAVAFYNAGMPVAGIFTTGIGMLQTTYWTVKDPFYHALSYVGFQFVCLIFIIAITIVYFNVAEKNKKALLSAKASIVSQSVQASKPSLWSTMKLIYPMMFATFFSWTVTMMILPNWLWALGLGFSTEKKDMELLLILMIYVLCDFLGRVSYSKYALKSNMGCHLLGLLRIVFMVVPIVAFVGSGVQALQDKPAVTITYTIAHALITGYMSSSQMHLTATRVVKRHKENAAYLVTLSMLFGQMYGSLANLVGLEIYLSE